MSHPHVCALHDVGRHDGVDYLVLELLEGGTLADRFGLARTLPGTVRGDAARRRSSGPGPA